VTDRQAIAIGAKYTFGDYTVGLGYENLTVDTVTFAAPAVSATPTDLDHIVLKLSGNISGFNVQGLIGQADGRRNGVAVNNAKQYAMSVSYTMDALSGTVFYTDDSALGGAGGKTAYGIGASYDLGGAAISGGIVQNVDTDESGFDLGITMSF
jgi:outer membrane protein OmpU